MLALHRGDQFGPEGVDNNGTVSFINFPEGKRLVTNAHVWNVFCERRQNNSGYRLILSGRGLVRPIDISDAELVSIDDDLDLCVLSYPPERIEELGKEFMIPPEWPPVQAVDGDDVLIIGFPGNRRSVESISHLQHTYPEPVLRFESFLFEMRVQGVSDRQARLVFSNPDIIQFSDRPIDSFVWGGMSGSLVYRADTCQNRLVACGIMHSASEGLDEVFLLTHLNRIRENGTIIVD
jgi:hypothetical protein